jgi:16S rRNA (cytosine967-C5)-methyltransferase
MPGRPLRPATARAAAASSLTRAAERFPDLPAVNLDVAGLDPRDAALATAIHRTVLQRWITLEYLLNRCLASPMHSLEPALQAVLLTGAAQLIFMQRLPAHAVVDEQVKLARKMVREGAAAMVNAVLRKVSGMVRDFEPDVEWFPARDRLPLDTGSVVLSDVFLPETDQTARYLAIATSTPRALVNRWLVAFGLQKTTTFCLHGVETPPVIVSVEPGFDVQLTEQYQPHKAPGFVVWRADQGELRIFLSKHPDRRVQDPASATPIRSTAGLHITRALDYCAGRGTKTRQLAVLHPKATIAATDIDGERRSALNRATERFPNVIVVGPESQPKERIDLLVLVVPCSNTAVLARRPEARYRFDTKSLGSLVTLQRQIVRKTVGWVRPGGTVLYSTCSLERDENAEQARWISQQLKGTITYESQVEPAGRVTDYRDGGYHALIRLP